MGQYELDHRLRAFVTAYPYPCGLFATTPSGTTQRHVPLEPYLTNNAYHSLLKDSKGKSITWLEALVTSPQASSFARWLVSSITDDPAYTPICEVSLTVSANSNPVRLQLCKTGMDDVWVVTSIPLTPLPPTSITYPSISSMSSLHSNSVDDTHITENSIISPYALPGDTVEPLAVSRGKKEVTREEMDSFLETFDWSKTSLGPQNTWPQSLRTVWSIVRENNGPASTWFGTDFTIIYNHAYASTVAGNKHPQAFGKKGSIAWGELWDGVGALAHSVVDRNIGIHKTDDRFFFDRLPGPMGEFLPEEVYYSWSWIPIKGENDAVVGMLNLTHETTEKVLAERRLQCLRLVGERTAFSSTQSHFVQSVLAVLEETPYEAPFAALYTYSTDVPSAGARTLSSPSIHLTLAGSIGLPTRTEEESHPLLNPQFNIRPRLGALWPDLESSSTTSSSVPSSYTSRPLTSRSAGTRPFTWRNDETRSDLTPTLSHSQSESATVHGGEHWFDWTSAFARAHRSKRPVLVSNLPSAIMTDVGKDRGWKDPVRDALVVPVVVDSGSDDRGENLEQVQDICEAVLIIGVNTRVPYSDDGSYGQWARILTLALGASLTAVQGREREAQRMQKLAELDSAKTAFFSNTSHELRTPLTLIGGPLNNAIDSITDPKIQGQLQMAARSVSRLNRLVDSLMDFAKLAGGRLQARFRPISISTLVADLAILFRSTIEKTGTIEYCVECELDERVTLVDPDALERILFNLIGNAFKFTMKGSITVRVAYTETSVILSVADTGVGIAGEELDRVFERFHRVSATSRSHEGTGIGLALVAELVRLHGAKISVTSTPETATRPGGSTFSVEFQLGMDHLPWSAIDDDTYGASNAAYARGIVQEASEWSRNEISTPTLSSSSDSGESSEGSLSSGTMGSFALSFQRTDLVLIGVDDNADMRDYIRSLFSPYCRTMEAIHGQQALELALLYSPHLIIADIMMPVLDGLEMCAAIRNQEKTKHTPIILLTAQADDDARLKGLVSGADDYLGKPFSARELVARAHLQLQIGKERVHLQGQFESSLHELRVLSEVAPVGIFRADRDRHVTFANHMWHHLTGITEDADMDDWEGYINPSSLPTALEAWDSIFETLKPVTMEIVFTNGRIVRTSMNAFLDFEGEVGVMGTLTDITELRRLEADQLTHAEERETTARRKAEESEERRRQQELLIDVTSHEIRQPVSAIMQNAELVKANLATLLKDVENAIANSTPLKLSEVMLTTMEADIAALEAIWQSGLAQERIANDVLSLSRMQLDVLSIIPIIFKPAEELRRITSLFLNELKIKNIHLTLEIPDSFERLGIQQVRLDKARFAQIVTNLMSNAIKFTDLAASNRSIRVSLDVRLDPPTSNGCEAPSLRLQSDTAVEEAYIYVSVSDSGPGLRPEDLALLFQRFSQGSNSHEVFGGSGLGLFVSRKLCDLMGGRIEVVSKYGQGATFRFFLKTEIPPRPKSVLHDGPLISATVPSDRQLRVLIVEDNNINQTVLNRQLKKALCRTALASNGVEALDAVKAAIEDPFDVILMDCEMPVMNGHAAARELRRLEASGQLPTRNYVIALTGNAREQQVQSARDAGMDDIMIKPYRINELLQLMHQRQLNHLSQ